MRATSTAVVPSSPDQVWAVLADHEGMSSWGPGMKAEVTTPGTAERNGVGAVRRISAPGPAPAIVEEITRFEPGHALGYKALGGVPFKNYRGEVLLTPEGDGTRIDWTLSADQRVPYAEKAALKGVASGLLAAFVRAVKKS
ncbi:SRPBCC family protein [Nocardioides sp. MH1]|uniref:SRPBCC family protein n=1 Tax=Nocardioides sp. MH1 TaxID=3242490 RepID=UPI003521FA01